MNWYPQALLTAEQAAAGTFFLKNDTPLSEMTILLYFDVFSVFLRIFENTK